MPAANCSIEGTFLDDIEDLYSGEELPGRPENSRKHVVPKVRKKKSKDTKFGEYTEEKTFCDSVIPGQASVYVKTWGCSHNNSDSEYMAGQLAAYGYVITDQKENADLWLLNSCTVKNPAEDHFRNEIEKGRNQNKHVVVAGCVPQGAPRSQFIQGLSVIGVQQIDRVTEVVEETLKGHTVRLLGQKKSEGKRSGGAPLSLPKIRKNPLIEIIAINTGCLNACTYCKTKHARGELGSYPIEDIVDRARQSFQEGVVELWITSEDLGAYGIDIGVTLPQLLWELVEVIPEGARMRLGMTNPPYILQHLEEIAQILRHERVYSFLHVPVQSASNAVLADMKREYTQEDFRTVADFLKSRVPRVTIATDVICGFPTETDKDFEETLNLVRDYKFPSLFINQFFPRPGTPAAKMPRIPPKQVKKRTKEISELFQSYHPYGHQVGEQQEVLATEVSHDGCYYVAHNKYYDQVLVPKEEVFLGKIITVEIYEAGKHYLKGRPIKEAPITRPLDVPAPLKMGQVSGISQITSGESSHPMWVKWTLVMVLVALVVRFTLTFLH